MLFAELDRSAEVYNVLRVENGGPAIVQIPAKLPIFESDMSSSQGFHVTSSLNSGFLSWCSTSEHPLGRLDSRQRRISGESFSLSPANVAEEGSDTAGNAKSDEEQHLLVYQNIEAMMQSRWSSSLSGNEASVESTD